MSPGPARTSARSGGRTALGALARAYGVQTSYVADDGSRRRAGSATVVAVLQALGAGLDTPDAAGDALAATLAERQRTVLQPVVALRPGVRHTDVVLGADVDPRRVDVRLERSDGSVVGRPLSELVAGPARLDVTDGQRRARHRLRLSGPMSTAAGYHRLTVDGPGVAAEALVVHAPRRCPSPSRGWGLFTPLHALRRTEDWGVATFSDLEAVGGRVAELGGAWVGTLPLLAAFLDGPIVEPSPYLPASRLAWNEVYVDVTRLPELAASPEAAAALSSASLREAAARLRSRRLAQPDRTLALKRRVLTPAADALFAGRSERLAALRRHVAAHPHLQDYARFRAAGDERSMRTHLYAQWVADQQLAEVATQTGLYVDLPVGVHPQGFDPAWAPEAFADRLSAGAPPDAFFPGGQSWGFPPLHPQGVRASRYRYPIAVLRHAMRHASVVRIDHVMGLHRMFVVPEGADVGDGLYVSYEAEEMHAIVVVEADRAGVAVVGEDLGTVPDVVRRTMRREGMLRSHVWQFASSPEDPMPEPPEDSLATAGTHDLPPFASFWEGSDVADRLERGLVDDDGARKERRARGALRSAVARMVDVAGREPVEGAGHGRSDVGTRQALGWCLDGLAGGVARLVMVDVEDLWLERQPQNRPGTGDEAKNFLRRGARTWDDAVADPRVCATLRSVAEHRGSTGGIAGGGPP